MRPLIDPPLDQGRPAVMTMTPPSEQEPQPVDDHPGWVWWPGVAGLLYARWVRAEPPVVVRAVSYTALLGRVRDAEAWFGQPGKGTLP